MSHEKTISDLAYHLWRARGCPNGSSEIDWVEAERQVRGGVPIAATRALDTPVLGSAPVAAELPQDPPPAVATVAKRAKKKTKR